MSRPKGGRSGTALVIANAQRCTSPFYAILYVHVRTRTTLAILIVTRFTGWSKTVRAKGFESGKPRRCKNIEATRGAAAHSGLRTQLLQRTIYVNAVRVCTTLSTLINLCPCFNECFLLVSFHLFCCFCLPCCVWNAKCDKNPKRNRVSIF